MNAETEELHCTGSTGQLLLLLLLMMMMMMLLLSVIAVLVFVSC